MTTKVTILRVQVQEKREPSFVRVSRSHSFCSIDPLEARNRNHAMQTTPFLTYSFTTVVNDVSNVSLRLVDANVLSSPSLSSLRHHTLFPLRSNIPQFKLFNFLLFSHSISARSPPHNAR